MTPRRRSSALPGRMKAASRTEKGLCRAPRRLHRPTSSPGAGTNSERPPSPQPPALRPWAERSRARATARTRADGFPEDGGRGRPRGEMGTLDGADPHSGETTGNRPLPLKREVARGALGPVGRASVVSTRLGEPLWCLTAAGGLGMVEFWEKGENTVPSGRVWTDRARRRGEHRIGDARSSVAPPRRSAARDTDLPAGGTGTRLSRN